MFGRQFDRVGCMNFGKAFRSHYRLMIQLFPFKITDYKYSVENSYLHFFLLRLSRKIENRIASRITTLKIAIVVEHKLCLYVV